MKTRAQVVAFLVAEGKPENFARAAVNETYNYDQDGATDDVCREDPDGEPIDVTDEQAIQAYDTMEEMFSVENNQICLDGEPMYDINGYHLAYQQ